MGAEQNPQTQPSPLPAKCPKCGRRLIYNPDSPDFNVSIIHGPCDDCLADQAADDRVYEWENGIGYE